MSGQLDTINKDQAPLMNGDLDTINKDQAPLMNSQLDTRSEDQVREDAFMERANRSLGSFDSPVGHPIRPFLQEQKPKSSVFDVPGALFRTENPLGSFVQNMSNNVQFETDVAFNAADSIQPYQVNDIAKLITSGSQNELDYRWNRIQSEQADKQILSEHPVSSFLLGIPMAVTDPTIMLPGGVFYKNYQRSVNIGKSALSVGVAAMGAASVSELALQQTQVARTYEESAANILASGVFGALIGGAGGAMSVPPAIRSKVISDIGDAYQGKNEPVYGPDIANTLSSAEVNPAYLAESEKLSNLGGTIGKATRRLNPLLDMATSDFTTANQFSEYLYAQSFVKNKNLAEFGGIARAQSLDTSIAARKRGTAAAMISYQDMFYKQAGIELGPAKGVRSRFAQQGLDWETWEREVKNAMINGNIHENANVAAAARHVDENVIQPITRDAIEFGLLPENVSPSTARGYFMITYNRQLIKEQPDLFRNIAGPWLKEQNELLASLQPTITDLRARIAIAEKAGDADAVKLFTEQLNDAVPRSLRHEDGRIRSVIDDQDIESVVDQMMQNVLNRNMEKVSAGRRLDPNSGKPKPTNNRAWLIPQERLDAITIGSTSEMVHQYQNSMVPAVEIARLGRELGIQPKNKEQLIRAQDRLTRVDEKLMRTSEKLRIIDEKINKTRKGTKIAKNRAERKLKLENQVDGLKNEVDRLEEKLNDLQLPFNANDVRGFMHAELLDELNNKKALAERKAGKDRTAEEDKALAKELAKLEKEHDRQVKNTNFGIDYNMGIFGNKLSDSAGDMAYYASLFKKWNVTRLLGSAVFASFSDLGYIIMRNGPGKFITEGLAPLLFKNIAKIENMKTLKDMGFAANNQIGNRLRTMFDLDDTALQATRTEKFLDGAVNFTLTGSGFNAWQDMVQGMAGNIGISKMLRAIDTFKRTGEMSDVDTRELAAYGLDRKHFDEIHAQWKRFGGKSSDSYYTNMGDWDLSTPEANDAYRAFRNSVFDYVTSTVIEPRSGDLPIIAREHSVLFQFKSFLMATNNSLLVSGLTRNDANYYMGFIAALSLGALSYMATSISKNPDEEIDLSPGKLLKESIDRSSMVALLMEGYNIGNKMLAFDGTTRYQSRGIAGALVGPTVGGIEDLLKVTRALSLSAQGESDMTTTDVKNALRLFPAQNMWPTQAITRELFQDAAVDYLDFKDNR